MPHDIIVGRNAHDKEVFGNRGLIKIGKTYVKMGQYTSLSNPLYLDVARSHVILVAGKRGSGKSYTLGVLTEELANLPEEVSQNIASLIFDTMGIYWTMKFGNEKDKDLLREWELSPKDLPVKVFVPYGYKEDYEQKGISFDHTFALDPAEMHAEDWILTFGLDILHPVAILIQRTLNTFEGENYTIEALLKEIEKDKTAEKQTKEATKGLFEAAQTWGVFAKENKEATRVTDLLERKTTTILDLSVYNAVGAFNVRALVISLLSRKIFNERMSARKKEEVSAIARGLDYSTSFQKKELPLAWLFIDEAHEFLPKTGKTLATDALIQLLREGRQPGVSLVLATQQPGQIHHDVMTQSDIVLAHRVTSAPDIEALNQMMQSYLLSSIKQHMDDLPPLKGSAIVLDDNSERIYPIRMRPRFTWHGGEAPLAIHQEKKL